MLIYSTFSDIEKLKPPFSLKKRYESPHISSFIKNYSRQ
jgi:hypothetical protein